MLGGFRPRIGEGVLTSNSVGGFRPRIGEGVLGWVVLDLE